MAFFTDQIQFHQPADQDTSPNDLAGIASLDYLRPVSDPGQTTTGLLDPSEPLDSDKDLALYFYGTQPFSRLTPGQETWQDEFFHDDTVISTLLDEGPVG